MTYLFTVEDTFQIDDRGLILGRGLPRQSTIEIAKSSPLILRRPDLSTIEATVLEIAMIRYQPDVKPEDKTTPIMINKGFTKTDVPIGTEVFLANQTTD
ncbi:hypothetical protein JO972_07280 [Verrucomicrobiaceae bacterium 5K15]|uniref:Uncharacterized protein n=1 Tax=Oceaniferula flava TaxID=2800421 RepID=A0AAE2SDX9_9BACT|nr:hypothetical protein [Oceaniferula flavus]MBK1854755.1 hypothetical protein [Oceaniferula flavus]MBM1136061.1 hypothetical protein [Oceaniferula flavus]